MNPFEAGADASLLISGELKNIKLTNKVDFSLSDGGLKELDLRMDSQLKAALSFNANGSAIFGYFSQAWEEVENEHFRLLGVKGKFTGLSTDEKIGKYPIAGLIWSVPCPQTCPVSTGQTQTPLRLAKAAGVIVWVYANLRGEVTFDGSFTPVSINAGNLKIGVKKDRSGRLEMVKSLTRAPGDSPRLIEVLGVDGQVGLKVFNGISADLDFFSGGLYIANAGIDAGFQGTTSFRGNFSYGTNDLASNWSWAGSICRGPSTLGAGAVFRGAAQFGVELDTSWSEGVAGSFKYSGQWPTDAEMEQPGRQGLWWTELIAAESCWEVTSRLPDTGQTASYTTTFGEDADYTINLPSYTDNGNGTVTDNVTGLMWQQNTVGDYTWYQAAGVYDASSNPTTQNVCAAQTTGGHSDWRLRPRKS